MATEGKPSVLSGASVTHVDNNNNVHVDDDDVAVSMAVDYAYDILECRYRYERLLNEESIVLKGIYGSVYELSYLDFKKYRRRMTIVDPFIRSVVENDEIDCNVALKTLEDQKEDLRKMRVLQASTSFVPTQEVKDEVNKRSFEVLKCIDRFKRATSKSKGVGMLCELEMALKTSLECPGCGDELPCCDIECDYSRTLLSIVERTDANDAYSDDHEEDEIDAELSIEEEYSSSEYDDVDEDMEGVSQEDDDMDSCDEDYDVNGKNKRTALRKRV